MIIIKEAVLETVSEKQPRIGWKLPEANPLSMKLERRK